MSAHDEAVNLVLAIMGAAFVAQVLTRPDSAQVVEAFGRSFADAIDGAIRGLPRDEPRPAPAPAMRARAARIAPDASRDVGYVHSAGDLAAAIADGCPEYDPCQLRLILADADPEDTPNYASEGGVRRAIIADLQGGRT